MLPLLFVLCAAIPAAMMLAGHYFNWPGVLGRPLHRLEAYAWGVSFMMVTPTAAVLYARTLPDLTPVLVVALFWAAAAGAGVATLGAWGLDWLVERFHRLQDRVDRVEYGPD